MKEDHSEGSKEANELVKARSKWLLKELTWVLCGTVFPDLELSLVTSQNYYLVFSEQKGIQGMVKRWPRVVQGRVNVTGFSGKTQCTTPVTSQNYYIVFSELRGGQLVAKYDDLFGAVTEWTPENEERVWVGVANTARAAVTLTLLPTRAAVTLTLLPTRVVVTLTLLPTRAAVTLTLLPTGAAVTLTLLPTRAAVTLTLLPTGAVVTLTLLPTRAAVTSPSLAREAVTLNLQLVVPSRSCFVKVEIIEIPGSILSHGTVSHFTLGNSAVM
uniref:Uncharacterized protein n=1 Tax=Timema monikensis TaxID=170555 RepID=A0A7R9E3B4_9NEOP|nr:unnamed protein product [Timema monikensis]